MWVTINSRPFNLIELETAKMVEWDYKEIRSILKNQSGYPEELINKLKSALPLIVVDYPDTLNDSYNLYYFVLWFKGGTSVTSSYYSSKDQAQKKLEEVLSNSNIAVAYLPRLEI